MSIGRTRRLPLGITTDSRLGAVRRRLRILGVIAAICVVAAAGLLVAKETHELAAAKPAYAPTAERSPAIGPRPAEDLASPAATEAPRLSAEPPGVAAPATISPNATEPSLKSASERAWTPEGPTQPAVVAPDPPSPPTVLRGAGIKPR